MLDALSGLILRESDNFLHVSNKLTSIKMIRENQYLTSSACLHMDDQR